MEKHLQVWAHFFCGSIVFLCRVFLMLSCLFIAALWSPAGKGLTPWHLLVMFIVFLLLFHVVSWVWCGTWLYRFLIFVVFLDITMLGFFQQFWERPWPKLGKMIELTVKLGEISDREHNKGSKIYPQNQIILDCIMPTISLYVIVMRKFIVVIWTTRFCKCKRNAQVSLEVTPTLLSAFVSLKEIVNW